VLFVDASSSSSSSSPLAQHDRSDAQVVASGIAQLRSIAEGASVSHAPRLMDAVEALANALVSAAAGELKPPSGTKTAATDRSYGRPSDRSETDDDSNARVHGSQREGAWRARSRKLLRALERRADEYVKEIEAAAHVSRAFSPRFVFSDLCGGDALVAVEKLRVLTRAARDAHVAAVRAVAAAEASFGAAALGGTFREEQSEGERAGLKRVFLRRTARRATRATRRRRRARRRRRFRSRRTAVSAKSRASGLPRTTVSTRRRTTRTRFLMTCGTG
jgi:hypothetical protein